MRALAILLMLSISVPAVAVVDEKKNDKKERVVCKREVKTASRMAGRVCRTQTQWDEQEAEKHDELGVVDHSYKAQKGNGAAPQ
jgi:hypothetical protein